MIPAARQDAANLLREQAASYRRLSLRAQTAAGTLALAAVADQCDDDARRIDPMSDRK